MDTYLLPKTVWIGERCNTYTISPLAVHPVPFGETVRFCQCHQVEYKVVLEKA